ncbi:hypothetical protein kam1_222 [Methylacidiphilum kamchatkense Kam1]|uniref:Uncharacterized protein n=1 Tax=Methylacidiphilum kamchatkense Kam1 TaxID=1202785 RepID=A0A516TJP4_9BACT|nr:hypothetical protein kam1_222 [Methylacidiphilum kamchatkense Kam1]
MEKVYVLFVSFFSFILFAYPTIGKAIENENASSIGEKKKRRSKQKRQQSIS